MQKNTLWIVVGGFIIIIAGLILWLPTQNQNQEENQEQTQTQTDAVREGWEMYQNSEFGFRIEHPPDADSQQEGGVYIKFTYLGGPQATGEITDGFTMTVGTHERQSGQSLEQFSQANYQEQLRVGDSLQSPTQTQLYGMNAYRYQVETLGEVTVYVVAGNDNERIHTLSYNIADPNNQDYEEMVMSMLQSFQSVNVQSNGMTNGGPSDESPVVDTVSLAMLEIGDDGEGDRYGCDYLAFVEREVTSTTAPLTAAMQELFSIATTSVDGHYNFIANTNDTLEFDRATVENGTAHIYLSGELSGLAGVCDDPRASIQIEQTALQFSTVNDVQLYLDGEVTDLTPSQR